MRTDSKTPLVLSIVALTAGGALSLGGLATGSADKAAQCHGKAATIVGSNGDDAGDQAIKGTGHRDVIAARSGNDVVQGRGGDDLICGGGGGDFLKDGSGDDHVYGNGSGDLIIGSDGDDEFSGAGGDDRISGGAGHDKCLGGPGADLAAKSSCEKIKSADPV
jgi:Ca2+-binding RTX toxin-like protein